jgi:hypothetical protein
MIIYGICKAVSLLAIALGALVLVVLAYPAALFAGLAWKVGGAACDRRPF